MNVRRVCLAVGVQKITLIYTTASPGFVATDNTYQPKEAQVTCKVYPIPPNRNFAVATAV